MIQRSTVVDLTAIEVAKHTIPSNKRYGFVNTPTGVVKNKLTV